MRSIHLKLAIPSRAFGELLSPDAKWVEIIDSQIRLESKGSVTNG